MTLVADALDRYVEANDSIREPDGLWHPSSISGCARKAVYTVRGVERSDPPGPKSRRVLFIGSVFHEHAQAALKLAAEPLAAEVYTEVRVLIPELNVTGSADQLLIFEDGTAELQEFKTIKEGFARKGGGFGFKGLTGPKEDHLEQVKCYVYGLRTYGGEADDGRTVPPLGDRLTRVRFTYIEKQTFDTREFVVEWDPAWAGELLGKLNELELYRGDPLSLPPRQENRDAFPCSWKDGRCDFFTRCWEQDGPGTPPSPDVW